MARPLRIELPGGRFHVTARGNEGKSIYRREDDRVHFLGLLAEATERFGIRMHAYVLMDNHYHLLVETPEANLSPALHWINAAYGMWFNRQHNRTGHLLQGRFKAVVVEDDAGWQEVARYVHLNPVRVAGFKRGKPKRAGRARAPRAGLVAEGLAQLRAYPWSSYRTYAGYGAGVEWLWRQPLDRLCGGRSGLERRAALRQYTEEPLRRGLLERPWDRLVAGCVLGSEAFARRLLKAAKGNAREQPGLRILEPRVSWPRIVSVLEAVKGEYWEKFSQRHKDWGRDAALWLGRRHGRYRLRELGELAGGMDYAAVGQAASRFAQRMERESRLRKQMAEVERIILRFKT
jgi:REP element-mobilizing transposase RayT